MKKVIFPGTFDPITLGHMDMIERTTQLFHKVVVAVANNPSKRTMISFEDRIQLVKKSVSHLHNVDVIGFSGLLVELVKEQNAAAIIRGVRNTIDFEYENQLAKVNGCLACGVQTIFFPSSEQYGFISSTVVREVWIHQGDIARFVPSYVLEYLQNK